MKSISILSFCIVTTALTACGGGTETVGTSGIPAMANQPPIFSDPLNITTLQSANLFDWRRNTAGLFNTLNTAPDLTEIPSVIADYEGQMLAQIGNREEYLGGGVVLRLDFNQGNGFGRVSSMDISGRDATYTNVSQATATNHQLSSFDNLDIILTSVTPTSVSGTLTGSVDESFLYVYSNLDTYTVDATIDGHLVRDPTTQNLLTALAGVIDGTITSNNDGQQTLKGIVAVQEQAGSGVSLP